MVYKLTAVIELSPETRVYDDFYPGYTLMRVDNDISDPQYTCCASRIKLPLRFTEFCVLLKWFVAYKRTAAMELSRIVTYIELCVLQKIARGIQTNCRNRAIPRATHVRQFYRGYTLRRVDNDMCDPPYPPNRLVNV
jgi:hypothetical protein